MAIATIRQLQDALRRVGILDAGYADDELDEPTRAALAKFQREAGLPREGEASGQPDAQTLSALEERAERSGRFILRGWVLSDGGPVSEIRVRAEDRAVNDLREPFGDREGKLTDRSGKFELLYNTEQLARGDKGIVDVMLTLECGRERLTDYRVYLLQFGTSPLRNELAKRSLPLSANGSSIFEPVPAGIPAHPVEHSRQTPVQRDHAYPATPFRRRVVPQSLARVSRYQLAAQARRRVASSGSQGGSP